MKDNERLPSLGKLQEKIDRLKKSDASGPVAYSNTDMAQAVRLIIDLIAGVIMGVGIGYFLDKWLITMPLFMIAGLFFGVAAGVKNMLRSAKLIDKKLNEQKQDDKIL